ncbi:hypothetical protein ABMA28_009425 [Loxostege sticticalis]|uniref:PiggyBac transposable element-derived protein domain-containing protein n=1 Tax=Loxostege sticticalis TaxID=481309 RepID=A0ABD0SE55_LOXSC
METITSKRFAKLRTVIHFNDNSLHKPVTHPEHDRRHKIRPIIDHLNYSFSHTHKQRLSLDEQMCATKVAHFLKQYLPNKPHKWGFKFYVICSLSEYAYNFEIYSGKNEECQPGEPDLGVVGNTVIRLCRNVPRMVNHIIYCDNYYTSIPLLHYLACQGIYALGTIQRNRLGKTSKLPIQKDFMKETVARGTYEEQVTNYEGKDISVTCWKDNKMVTLASTYKATISIPCPKIIKDYNSHMGGVDLMDSFLGRHRIRIKSRKWYMRLFLRMIDLSVINSWILYKKVNEGKGNTKNMNLGNIKQSRKRIERLELKAKRGKMSYVPPKDVRTDGIAHHERRCEKKNRCKLPNCKGFTRVECTKCNVALCHTKTRNCFGEFHGF